MKRVRKRIGERSRALLKQLLKDARMQLFVEEYERIVELQRLSAR
jgi:hypothetical protein